MKIPYITGEKTPWTRARRWLSLSIVFLAVGTLLFFFNYPSIEKSLPVNSWKTTSVSTQFYNNTTTEIDSSKHQPPQPAQVPVSPYFVAYPHQYSLILDEPSSCGQQSPFLVLMIPVAPYNKEARDIIRNTWGKETTVFGKTISHYFLLGLSGEESGPLQEQVVKESQKHRDILQSSFVDSYMNLTIKTMVMFEWLRSHCPNTTYAMKIDSDMFLNVHNLVDMLLNAPKRLYMTGLVARDATVLRDPSSKWFLPESAFPDPTYPPYALGLGYVFSLDLPKKILEAALHVKAVYIEDVYVGLCMRHLGITLTDPPHGGLFQGIAPFQTGNCYWTSVITTILDSSSQLSSVWEIYQTQRQGSC